MLALWDDRETVNACKALDAKGRLYVGPFRENENAAQQYFVTDNRVMVLFPAVFAPEVLAKLRIPQPPKLDEGYRRTMAGAPWEQPSVDPAHVIAGELNELVSTNLLYSRTLREGKKDVEHLFDLYVWPHFVTPEYTVVDHRYASLLSLGTLAQKTNTGPVIVRERPEKGEYASLIAVVMPMNLSEDANLPDGLPSPKEMLDRIVTAVT